MIKVKLTENLNHHLKKGTMGEISPVAFETYGVGQYPELPHKVEVFINNQSQFILNTKLELA
jgi:hypothetical protein